MEAVQTNQDGNESSAIWTIIKILFAVGIIYFGIMYFSKKRDAKEDKFVKKKAKKSANAVKTTKITKSTKTPKSPATKSKSKNL